LFTVLHISDEFYMYAFVSPLTEGPPEGEERVGDGCLEEPEHLALVDSVVKVELNHPTGHNPV
jgi:hypothetical protein